MSAYHNNLALHISEATLKAQRRLDVQEQPTSRWLWTLGAAALALVANAIWLGWL